MRRVAAVCVRIALRLALGYDRQLVTGTLQALIPGRKMNYTRVVALITSLLLLAGQGAASVHAADHPFHVPDEICDAFASLEQNENALAVLPPSSRSPHCTDDANTATNRIFFSYTSTGYRVRAPPLHT